MTQHRITPQQYEEFRAFLQKASGIVLGDNKHYLLTSRLNRVMREHQIDDFSLLMQQLSSGRNPKLRELVIDAMTTNETLWFRDRYPFELLKLHILPEFSERKPMSMRIWSAASSTGQEAYSISITIQEYLAAKPRSLPANVQIIGTDISNTVLKEAQAGKYDQLSLKRGVSEDRLRRYFTADGEMWGVNPEIKNRVSFREMNLATSYTGLGKFDIIFCRNVLIYFSSELKSDILNRLAGALNPGGYLFLGGSESPNSYTDIFEMVRLPQGVVYRLKEGATIPLSSTTSRSTPSPFASRPLTGSAPPPQRRPDVVTTATPIPSRPRPTTTGSGLPTPIVRPTTTPSPFANRTTTGTTTDSSRPSPFSTPPTKPRKP